MDLDFSSALDAAEAIRRKRVSSSELTRRIFERIDRLNPKLNAFVHKLRDDALARARSLGALHGVLDMLNWIAAPTLTGCPATSAPIGRTAAGLPVNIQIMGPYQEDATPISFAGLMAQELGGFMRPPGY